ncbi:MAG: patatin-like protein [Drouetiella hepatica Uher 2000/2452]|jgi:patatin-related protein|uniref:Patatin-like protein n=1 Tax=Drouetiella hepatica Uher 2000/2452 TaxID=904376 RepID=A0A951QBB6_9CYAN|nr:patatin-like protein [Drouetiella hepatica Uher 2000/2452]
MSELTPENQQTVSHVDFNQEFRLGLVVYGGVSLAVYMNGVCREFYHAVRGRGVYKLLKALTDSDIIVDVLSGTSAGGINGILLSYALTNSTKDEVFDFKDFANIWRESGSISQLLRTASEPPRRSRSFRPGEEVDSVLDGKEYYQNQLANAFQTVWKNKAPAPVGEWFSPSSELDLFITGTDLLGKVYKAFDNTGNLIEVKEHRTVFHLKYRAGRKHDFEPAENQIPQRALAKLCRITSCFPVAFPVVSVKLKTGIGATQLEPEFAIDRHLVSWGQLENRELPSEVPPQGYQLHFVDGGVLDNRPFSYTINEIYRRTAYRPAKRKMFYIDPSPDRFLDSPKFRRMDRPNILQVATDSLVGMPRYESIANDLKEINDRNEKVRRYKFLRATAQRAVKKAGEKNEKSDNHDDNSKNVYLRCRLVGLRDRILPLILRLDQVANPDNQDKAQLLEKAAKLLTQYVADESSRNKRETSLNLLSAEIRNLDIDYALRKHFFFLEKICELMSQPQEDQERQKLAKLAGDMGLQVQLLETIQAGLVQALQMQPMSQVFYDLIQRGDSQPENRQQIYDYLLKLHRFLLDNDLNGDQLPSTRTSERSSSAIASNFFETFDPAVCTNPQRVGILNHLLEKAERLGKLFEQDDRLGDQPESDASKHFWENDRYIFVLGSENNSPQYCSFLVKIEEASEHLIQNCQHSENKDLLLLFERFRDIDQAVYSFEYLSNIQAKEQIEIIRVSPNDAQKGLGKGKGLEDKLAGDQLRAFGGFFKKSWRSNDILWGRLDGVNRIVDALLTPETLAHFSGFLKRQIKALEEQSTPRKTIAPQDYLTGLIQETLPHATETEKQAILASLLKLIDPEQTLTDQQLKEISVDLQERLVLAEHRAIVRAELGNVLEDAIDEQFEWNQQHIRATKDAAKIPTNLAYKPVSTRNLSGDQVHAVSQLNHIIKGLVDPKLLAGVASSLVPGAQTIDQEQYLQQLMQTTFPKSSLTDRRKLSVYLLAATRSTAPTDDLYRFFNQLLAATSQELSYPTLSQEFRKVLEGIQQQVEKIIHQLKPTYQPVSGYFDRAITPFVATELARNSTQTLLQDGKAEAYFRNSYRVGSESLSDGIPSIILKNLAAQTGMVLRNVVTTSAVGDRVKSTWIFQIFNTVLRLFYWSVRSKNSKSRLGSSPLSPILELIALVAIAAVTVILISKIPYWLMVILLSIPALWLIFAAWRFFTKGR